ncbi:squalene synthase HpnC [Protofrankia sp. BMG5.30]|uniref:squalene synthase HpnC n=1 Tax=Protofrankia sp. BMG5.30 TaxID=1834514 RepID=UPI0009768555|nr:squalene synthase HpnC [Protofrankia sp. BMG5.30]ONH34227.1 squalene synthase HpnC [Protofrankia sp. BMG5.30]
MTTSDAKVGSPPGGPTGGRAGTPGAPLPGDALTSSPQDVLRAASAENFPVSPLILPARQRQHLFAIYGFARLVDDIGDEASGDRLALLDALEADLDRIWGGTPTLPVIQALAPTVRECGLAPEPFRRLVAANRQDQLVTRYDTFDDLLRYCTLSADPVGHMVLGVFGVSTPDRVELSNRVCTALQIVEHVQDVAEDYAAGRIYLPREDLDSFGVHERDLAHPSAGPAVRELIAFQVLRARRILDEGTPLVGLVEGRLRLVLAGFVGGGRAALDAVERAGCDVLGGAPTAPKPRIVRYALAVALTSLTPSARRAARSARVVLPPLVTGGGIINRPAAGGGGE